MEHRKQIRSTNGVGMRSVYRLCIFFLSIVSISAGALLHGTVYAHASNSDRQGGQSVKPVLSSTDGQISASPALYNEVYRPQYHFTPVGNWMNDPNGLVYYQGMYHLFYQYNPAAMVWGPMHWGHAVSTDLVHWQTLPIALFPDDAGDIWSGSIVADTTDSSGFFNGGSGLVAIYTAAHTVPQQQSIAYSKDGGTTWTKYAGNPVIPNPGVADFRDPKVFWYAPTQRWIMIVAGGTVRFYSSPDLKTWTSESQLTEQTECPDLFPLPVDGNVQHQEWVLSLGGRSYELGTFNGHTFSKTAGPFTVDFGADFYAAQSYSNIPTSDGRRIWIGWMDNWDYAQQTPTAPWRGAMTVPRSLSLKTFAEGVRLVQTPVTELQGLRGQHTSLDSQKITAGSHTLAAVSGDTLDITAQFHIGTASEFGLAVRTGTGQQTTIGYDVSARQLFVDRTQSGTSSFSGSFAARHVAALVPNNNTVKMRILVDRSSVEVFGDDGHVVFTDQIFPDASSQGVQVYATGGSVTLSSLDAYQVNSIWATPPTALVNSDFESGTLAGWSVVSGTEFTAANVTNLTSAQGGDGEVFGQQGSYHFWGYKAGGDAPTGEMISNTVTVGGSGLVDFLIGGGNDSVNLYIALVKAADGTELFRATGQDSETYRRVVWDASAYIGTPVYLKVVDNATGRWGHLNLDDIHLPGAVLSTSTLTNSDFENQDLSGWRVVSGTEFNNAGVTNLTSAQGGDGEVFNQQGSYHFWGFKAGGDGPTGEMVSQTVTLGGSGQVSLLVGGGNDSTNLYVALVNAADGTRLFTETGRDTETYHTVTWDASAYIGTAVYIVAVDNATGGWGHINLDGVNVPTS